LKRYSHAAAIYQKLANQDSLNYYYQKKLGDCYFRYQQNKKALNAFWTAHTLNPNDLSVYTRLANLFVREKAYSETIQIVRKGLKKDSTVGDFYSLLGFANFRMKHYDSAFIFFAKAIELGDSTKFNYKYAGLSRYDSQDFKKAARFLLLAFEKDSTDVQVVFYLGSAMGRGGREKEGLDYLFKAYDLIQPDKESLLDINKELARTYNMLEKPKQALFYYKQAYKVKPEPELAFQMAYIYDHSLANKKMALNYYEGFLTMLPEKDTLEGNNMIEQGFQISLAEIASQRIKAIKEEFFWKGENPDSTGLK
jgi:tetratricopeptide (TPR) repeat protein